MIKPRNVLLEIMAIATTFTLGKSIANPDIASPAVANYSFPESVHLSQWQLAKSSEIHPHSPQPKAYISGDFVAGRHYRYRGNQQSLDIEMRYFANTDGNLKDFVTSQTGELSTALKQSRRGVYSLYSYENRAYLSTCINPHGNSTITSDEFKRNLMVHDTRIDSVLPWLLGKAEFRDKRCLWAHLSMPLDRNILTQDTYSDLETAWSNWYDYWQSNYPQR
ncbi:MAG: cyanoexosortase A system-associated protein [Cyanobacteria bacterium J06648_1]